MHNNAVKAAWTGAIGDKLDGIAVVFIYLFIMNSYRKYTYRPSLYKYMQ